ncbi:Protein RALF-like 9 [Cardamine amara subsp. amara]|uniref:Protein RALF-like 9 n=1 Tax=Cardamine amara subsp. amara TaxID=228776 RepID=A0ABD0ZB01_CARAN
MGMSKSVKVILSLALAVFLALAANKIEATKYIDYGPIKSGNHGIMCDRTRPETCKLPEANPYTRGCEDINRCHRGG